jgi:signal transduction histidine kinase
VNIDGTDSVFLSVQDNGSGISKENLDKIFKPFFTTKGERGTGLGLPSVMKFVKDNRGELKVETKEGEGSTFTLLFPVIKEKAKAEAA